MYKTQLINYFINLRNYRSYLEISVHNMQENFAHINCADKKIIINKSENNAGYIDDDKKEFDVIFIDGVHTEERVLNDITYAWKKLAKHGVIILHDCMPPDAWHQREMTAYREGECWNGTVWKAALRVFNATSYKCTLLDTDWGCGIIDTAKIQFPKKLQLPEKLDYGIHYPLLLKYKQSPASYLREQVKVFYHLACMGNWKDIFNEQMQQLAQNDFRRINMIVLGTQKDLAIINSTCKKLNIKINLIFNSDDLSHFEKPALMAIEKYALQNEGYVLYLHSKGVSNPADETKIKWRRLMMQELIEKWEHCMQQLPQYDIIGVNWRSMHPISHFCGNFWYASTKYLRKLADFNYYYDNIGHEITDTINSKRLNCEFWISSGAEAPKLLSLYCTNVDFCNHEFWKNK